MKSLFELMNDKTFIIGEAGVNHNGDVELAKKLVDAAKECGADAVKFQTWKQGECTGRFAIKVDYLEGDDSESRFDISNKLMLPYEAFVEIKKHCEKVGILFLSTPDGYESLDFLVDELDMPFIKISSTETTHLEFLKKVGQKKRPVILSTGMCNLGEVEEAYYLLKENGAPEVCILHCTSEYPAPDDELNLRALKSIGTAFDTRVGYSDHSLGKEASLISLAYDAQLLEKHFTLDREMDGPDHKASCDLVEFKDYISSVRRAEKMLGTHRKHPTTREKENMPGIRRGIVATGPLEAGTVLKRSDLTFKRPFRGVEPRDIDKLLGFKLNRSLQEDEPVTWDDIK